MLSKTCETYKANIIESKNTRRKINSDQKCATRCFWATVQCGNNGGGMRRRSSPTQKHNLKKNERPLSMSRLILQWGASAKRTNHFGDICSADFVHDKNHAFMKSVPNKTFPVSTKRKINKKQDDSIDELFFLQWGASAGSMRVHK